MKPKHSDISKELTRARKRYTELLETSPELGKFVIQQNKIQTLLVILITLRASQRGLIDKKWIDWLEQLTLGMMIKIYQPSANRIVREADFIAKLERYKSGRNKLIHKLEKMRAPGQIKKVVGDISKLGAEIENELSNLVNCEYKL